jgi:hypothetical protein
MALSIQLRAAKVAAILIRHLGFGMGRRKYRQRALRWLARESDGTECRPAPRAEELSNYLGMTILKRLPLSG